MNPDETVTSRDGRYKIKRLGLMRHLQTWLDTRWGWEVRFFRGYRVA